MHKPLSPTLWFLALFFLTGISALTYFGPNNTTQFKSMLVPPPEKMEYFSFGFQESMADSLWLRWIQDSDVCQIYVAQTRKLRAAGQVSPWLQNSEHKVCDQSWSFKMLDAVTRLSPRFEMPYTNGAPLLAVEVEDYAGATIIFDRGVQQYPKNWLILYRAAYHFLYDIGDLRKAAKLLEQAGENGAPIWLRSLASRIYTEAGQLELGISALIAYRAQVPPDRLQAIHSIDERIAELKAKMAKEP